MSLIEDRPMRILFYFVIIIFVSLVTMMVIYYNGGSEIDPIKTYNVVGDKLEITMILTTIQLNMLIGIVVGVIVFILLHRFYLRLRVAVEEFKVERNGK